MFRRQNIDNIIRTVKRKERERERATLYSFLAISAKVVELMEKEELVIVAEDPNFQLFAGAVRKAIKIVHERGGTI